MAGRPRTKHKRVKAVLEQLQSLEDRMIALIPDQYDDIKHLRSQLHTMRLSTSSLASRLSVASASIGWRNDLHAWAWPTSETFSPARTDSKNESPVA
jgi:hypothetical protein